MARKNSRSGQRRILIAGDEPEARALFTRKLRAEGYEVVGVASRHAALSQLRSGRFDVLVLDLDMPDLEGFRVLTEIRRKAPSVRILAVSEDIPLKVLEVATIFGATSTLGKSAAGRSLVHETRRLLGEMA